MTQNEPVPAASDIVKQYYELVRTLERLKQEVETTDFFGDTHDRYFEEERFLERVRAHVRDIQLVVDWYRDFV
jgi:hypothetical protein